jgi:hypothetical protein
MDSPKQGRITKTVIIDQETGECFDCLQECPRCEGTGYAQLSDGHRIRAAADMNQYQQPRLSHATLDGDLKVTPDTETLAEFLSRSRALKDAYPYMRQRAIAPPSEAVIEATSEEPTE